MVIKVQHEITHNKKKKDLYPNFFLHYATLSPEISNKSLLGSNFLEAGLANCFYQLQIYASFTFARKLKKNLHTNFV